MVFGMHSASGRRSGRGEWSHAHFTLPKTYIWYYYRLPYKLRNLVEDQDLNNNNKSHICSVAATLLCIHRARDPAWTAGGWGTLPGHAGETAISV